jgi:hypothetical protein
LDCRKLSWIKRPEGPSRPINDPGAGKSYLISSFIGRIESESTVGTSRQRKPVKPGPVMDADNAGVLFSDSIADVEIKLSSP